jgi:glutamine cyclotransferase
MPLPADRFGEGLALVHQRLYQLTWKEHVGYVYDAGTLALVDSFRYQGEGWGLTTDGTSLIMSNGGPTLQWVNPQTFQVTRIDTVRDGTAPLSMLNELEYVAGKVYANVYQSDWIVRINAATGRIERWYDFSGILPAQQRTSRTDALNGIAYDAADSTFLVTGKRWPSLYVVRLRDAHGLTER